MTTPRMFTNQGEVISALRLRFPLPEYALLPGVADATGTGASRTADALIMSCWPSRGLALMGVEVKVTRSDWLRELKKPAKAEAVCRFCDAWYIAVGQAGIVKAGELPPTWGLIVPKGGKLIIARQAPKLDPVPMDRQFLASILRRASEDHYRKWDQALYAAKEEGRREGREASARSDPGSLERVTKERDELLRVIAEFRAASGIGLSPWDGGTKVGEAVKFVLYGGLDQVPRRVEEAEKSAQRILDEVKAFRAAVEAAKGAS